MPLYRHEYDFLHVTHTSTQGWLTGKLEDRIAAGWRPIGLSSTHKQETTLLLRRRRWFWQSERSEQAAQFATVSGLPYPPPMSRK